MNWHDSLYEIKKENPNAKIYNKNTGPLQGARGVAQGRVCRLDTMLSLVERAERVAEDPELYDYDDCNDCT